MIYSGAKKTMPCFIFFFEGFYLFTQRITTRYLNYTTYKKGYIIYITVVKRLKAIRNYLQYDITDKAILMLQRKSLGSRIVEFCFPEGSGTS